MTTLNKWAGFAVSLADGLQQAQEVNGFWGDVPYLRHLHHMPHVGFRYLRPHVNEGAIFVVVLLFGYHGAVVGRWFAFRVVSLTLCDILHVAVRSQFIDSRRNLLTVCLATSPTINAAGYIGPIMLAFIRYIKRAGLCFGCPVFWVCS